MSVYVLAVDLKGAPGLDVAKTSFAAAFPDANPYDPQMCRWRVVSDGYCGGVCFGVGEECTPGVRNLLPANLLGSADPPASGSSSPTSSSSPFTTSSSPPPPPPSTTLPTQNPNQTTTRSPRSSPAPSSSPNSYSSPSPSASVPDSSAQISPDVKILASTTTTSHLVWVTSPPSGTLPNPHLGVYSSANSASVSYLSIIILINVLVILIR